MIEALYETMMIPESCRLGKRVYKKLFHENANLNATDKKALSDDVDTIVWQYTFKPTTIPIQPYDDDNREYHEVALLQVNLKQTGRMNRLAEIVHRAIPYPVILIFTTEYTEKELTTKDTKSTKNGEENVCGFRDFCGSKIIISLANKRFSHAEKEAIVAEDFQATGWMDLVNPTKPQVAFLDSLNITTWPHTHFFAFYKAAMARVIALACAEHTGRYSLELPGGLSADDRAGRLKQVEKLQQEKSELAGKLKKEKNLGTQVQLNTAIRKIKNRIEEITLEL